MSENQEATRSPLKDKPLRLPGQSLQEERQRLLEDKVETWLLLSGVLILFAAMEWFRHLRQSPPQPVLMSIVAMCVCAIAAWRFYTVRPKLRALRLGMEGERAVGQFLERMRKQGYEVFHDVLGEGFNIDHVLIGSAGVFTIETKTWSKSNNGHARIQFDGERLLVNGFEPERNVPAQVRAQAGWLRRTLEESTGRHFDVLPVVVFPGWYVEAVGGARRAMWVLEPKALPAFIANEPTRLAMEEVKMAAFHLSRYVRAREQRAASGAP